MRIIIGSKEIVVRNERLFILSGGDMKSQILAHLGYADSILATGKDEPFLK